MPTCLLCAHCLIRLFIHFLSLLHALVKLLGAFQVLHTAFCVFLRACCLLPSLLLVPGSLRELVGLSRKSPEVSQLAGLQGHDLLCAWGCCQLLCWMLSLARGNALLLPTGLCGHLPALLARLAQVPARQTFPEGNQGMVTAAPEPGWEVRDSWHGSVWQFGLSADKCSSQEETTAHRASPGLPGVTSRTFYLSEIPGSSPD